MKDIQPLEKKITALFTTLEAWAGWCAGMALSFVTPIVPFILLSLALVVADTVTGIIAARRRGELRTSRGYRRFVEKCAVYAVAVLSFHGLTVVFMPGIQLAYGAALAICLTEIKSISENTRSVSGVNIFEQIKDMLPGNHIDEKPEEKQDQ